MFQVWVLYLQESPFHSYAFEPKDVFNWTATYRRDSDIPIPYNRWVYYDERVKQNATLDHNYAANKTKKVSSTIVVLLLTIRYRKFCIPHFLMPIYFVNVWLEGKGGCCFLVIFVCVVNKKIVIYWLNSVHQNQTHCTPCTTFCNTDTQGAILTPLVLHCHDTAIWTGVHCCTGHLVTWHP